MSTTTMSNKSVPETTWVSAWEDVRSSVWIVLTNECDMAFHPNRCIIHVSEEYQGVLIPINEERWETICKVASIRKQWKKYKKSKYFGIIENLPNKPGNEDGYHRRCYSAFTSVPRQSACSKEIPIPDKILRSNVASLNECLFCGKKEKTLPDGKKEKLGEIRTKEAENNIREAVELLQDEILLLKITNIDLVEQKVVYHHTCRRNLQNAVKKLDCTPKISSKSETKSDIFNYVKTNVIDKTRSELLKSIHDRYLLYCDENCEEPTISSPQYMGILLQKEFPEYISITSSRATKLGAIVHPKNFNDSSNRPIFDFNTSEEGQILAAALLLRKHLKNVKKTPFDVPLNIDSLKRGEGKAPELVELFFQTLYGGINTVHSEKVNHHVASACDDALFNVHNGQLKPKKHILLGIFVKALTGSRKLMTVLNRFGHCISYSKEEELETELATAIQNRKKSCPKGAKYGPVMGNAFDNYDEMVQTLSGFNTLHDTMGIFYQNIDPFANEIDEDPTSEDTARGQPKPSTSGTQKKKRKLEVVHSDEGLMPYRKKICLNNLSYEDTQCEQVTDISENARKIDMLFMLKHNACESVPMWCGFNSQIAIDSLQRQVVLYMPNLNRPITDCDVVVETMRTSMKCANECGQKYGLVTYDLDVAKTAFRIQESNAEFDNLFIMCGVFHISMCFFRAIGKIIVDSGGPAMLMDSEILAPGALSGFLECKNYNRCKRLHPMLALAFEILLFRQFMLRYEKADDIIDEIRELVMTCTTKDEMEKVVTSEIFQDLFDNYEKFTKDVEAGSLGKTAQFWAMYIKYIHLYHLMERSVRENNIDLFIATLTPLIDLFFATNRINYARWMCKYQLKFLNIDKTHPGLRQLLCDGGFSIRRSDNNFSRMPIDLTLEQTVNADAASRLSGYTSSTNNFNSRLRWSITKSSRATLVSEILNMVGLENTNYDHREQQPSRMSRDKKDLNKIIRQIESCANPFTLDPSLPLINISTGRSVPDEICNSLLSIPREGEQRRQTFVQECYNDPTRFERPIKKNPLRNFAHSCVVNRKAGHNTKEAYLKCTNQLLGRVAFTAAKTDINLEYVFSFPLTPVPLTLCRGDGTMARTEKSQLLQMLEKTVDDHGMPSFVGTYVIDGNFQLHCMPPDMPLSYGEISQRILTSILSYKCQRIDINFDTYERPSIKDCERERRGAVQERQVFTIEGPEQKRPQSFQKMLTSESFKRELPTFLAKNWQSDHYKTILEGREVYLGVRDSCTRLYVENGVLKTEIVPTLSCNHAEADTRTILNMIHADHMTPGDIIIRGSDTDILVLLLHHMHRVKSNVWMEVGTRSRGTVRYINVAKIAAAIGPSMCAALPGLHAFTGSDYTSAFVRKGKTKPFSIVHKNQRFQKTFSSLSQKVPNKETIKSLQDFVCLMYGARNTMPLNKYRYQVVNNTYSKKGKTLDPFHKLKSIEGSSIPPSEAELSPHIDRSAFVARLWGSAHKQLLKKTPDNGWDLEDGSYRIIWFQGNQLPSNLASSVEIEHEESDNDKDEDHTPFLDEMESSDEEELEDE